MNYLTTGTPPGRTGNAHPNLSPYQVFDCSDGWAIIAVGNDAQFTRLCELLGCPEFAADTRFSENAGRVVNRPELARLLSERTVLKTRTEILDACEAHGVPAGPINDMGQVFADPQIVHRNLVTDAGPVPVMRNPIRAGDMEMPFPDSAPGLDADGDEIRARYGRPTP